ncbi:MAG: DUF4389 domain-containing protein, partial [Chitinivibrionales bacterium]|nr:DUF4389 domain-containing protein [Chitinivibrionales bacterium]MBD3395068.1 DUF4389 domain-containing protein [Chitinivibrionales bacterium]
MEFTVRRQEIYSRAELLLRTIFGWIYIMVPHAFLQFFVGIWSGILGFLAFWVVLFTGEYPESWYSFQIGFMNWRLRVQATLMNLVDEYPAFGVGGTSESVHLAMERPAQLSRGLVLLRL